MRESDRRLEFEAMFRGTYEHVFAYALRRADAAEAEDVVAETYLTAWRRFDAVPADALPWLYGVARRVLANTRRSTRRRAQLRARLAGEYSAVVPDPGNQLIESALMRLALARLSNKDREALMLVAWEGLDNERASIVLGVSTAAFAVRLHRARRRLDAEFDKLTRSQSTDEDVHP